MASAGKRRREEAFAEDEEVFVEGSIVRITMHNFLTYDHTIVHPGPNLNMIVGANGTGKSSIVCALCLGLAGKTAVLGRGDKVGGYVKRGCTKGSVEIELYKRGGNLVIFREIQVENNASVWTLNGRHSSQRAVEEEVKALHIQVGNLCQFLPQEKVGEFAKMSNVELLEATEKSVGPPEMFQFHCELKTFRTKEKELENAVKEKASFLEKAKQSNERNKHDVKRYLEKQKHLDQIKLLEKKKPWVEYEVTREQLEGLKGEREGAKAALRSLKEQQAPLARRIQSLESKLAPIQTQMTDKGASIRDATTKCKQKQDQLDRKHKEIEDLRQALSLKQTEEADRRKRISNSQRLIADLCAELERLAEQPDLAPRLDALHAELRRVTEDRARTEEERADLRREKDRLNGEYRLLKNKQQSVESMMNRKEAKLKERSRDTVSAIQWLRQNKHRFTGRVHEPMMLVINVKDSRFAKYVENHISFNDLRAFVFERKDDMRKFMDEVRDGLNLRVNSISAPAVFAADQQPSRPLDALRRFGFVSYLRELFDAPVDVMSYLCHQYRVHDVPVGTEQTRAMIKEVIQEPSLKVLYTAEERYQVKKSMYSNQTSTSNSAVRPSQYLTIQVDADEMRRLDEHIKSCEAAMQGVDAQMNAAQTRAAKLDHRDNELRAEKKQLSELKGKKRQLEQKISAKQESLRQMEQGGLDLQKAEDDTRTRISAVNTQKVAVVTEMVAHMKARVGLNQELVFLSVETVGLTAEKSKLETEYRQDTAQLRTLEQALAQVEQRKERLVETCKALLKRARQVCSMGPGDTALPNKLYLVSPAGERPLQPHTHTHTH